MLDQVTAEIPGMPAAAGCSGVVDPVSKLMELRPTDPKQVGPYRLLGILAGGIARVYLGQSPGGRLVAVKVISAGSWRRQEDDFRSRFAQEVKAAQRVSGIFTAPVVDADPEAPEPWLATAYVAGPTLDTAVSRYGPLPVSTVLALAAGLAEGLGAIHKAGLVHRDVKPSNMILASDGPRIIDFGISLASETIEDTDLLVGTPLYMSPEQVQGHRVGPPTDIFSLGSVLVFAATGNTPYRVKEINQLFYHVVHSQPDLRHVPAALRPIVERCLAKDPRLRLTTDQILAKVGSHRLTKDWLPQDLETVIYRYALPSAAAATKLTGTASASRTLTNIEVARAMVRLRKPIGHAFISYAREDSFQVDQLQQTLEAAGVPVWRDTADLWPGEDWRTKIRRAITDNALAFIACFSKASLARSKSYQNEELTLAVEQLRLRLPDDPWLMPVRLNECEIPDLDIGGGRTLRSIQWADLFGRRSDQDTARLVASVLRILERSRDSTE
jgi:tRNA A-37 threonylcarbamoyl transferase component Bud32